MALSDWKSGMKPWDCLNGSHDLAYRTERADDGPWIVLLCRRCREELARYPLSRSPPVPTDQEEAKDG